jgi:ubiquinone/menaquinone biosynthesis C-methylase UbiE
MIWTWLAIGLGVILLALCIYWAFVITEGAYLGARIVAWTYDLAARRYDNIKQFHPSDDRWFLAQPLLNLLRPINCPLILDVATGTGRLPQALLQSAGFDGAIVGLDLSRRMLQQAAIKLQALDEHANHPVTLILQDALHLPFPDATFDAVACLEALEFMPDPERALSEMARVLRPGGVLLITNRVNWESKLMPGKAFTKDTLRAMLKRHSLPQVEIRPWQVYYDLVWARKAGVPSRLGHGTWDKTDFLRCPHCAHIPLKDTPDTLHCPACDRRYPVRDGLHLLSG